MSKRKTLWIRSEVLAWVRSSAWLILCPGAVGIPLGNFQLLMNVAKCIHGGQEQCFHNLIFLVPKFIIWIEFLGSRFEPNCLQIFVRYLLISQSIMCTGKAVSLGWHGSLLLRRNFYIPYRFIIIIQLLFPFPWNLIIVYEFYSDSWDLYLNIPWFLTTYWQQ